VKRYFLAVLGLALLGAAPAWGQAPAACCPPACCAPGENVCVPEHYCKETKKWVYNCGHEEFCLCYFPSLFHRCGCESGHCEHPHHRRYLVKKPRVCKEDAVKCVLAPAGCAADPCLGPGQMYFPNGPVPQGAAPGMAPGPRPMAAPGPMSYGPPGMIPNGTSAPMPSGPPEAFGSETAFTPPAPRPGAFGSPTTAFSPGR
jgi:hypothetical protein